MVEVIGEDASIVFITTPGQVLTLQYSNVPTSLILETQKGNTDIEMEGWFFIFLELLFWS